MKNTDEKSNNEMAGSPLGDVEELVIIAITRLGDKAYGMAIEKLLLLATNNKLNVRGLYTTLQRLKNRGLIREVAGVSESSRGPARKYYKVTQAGEIAIVKTDDMRIVREKQRKKVKNMILQGDSR